MVLQAPHGEVAHFVGEALQSGYGEGASGKVVVGEVLPVDGDQESPIPEPKSDLEELSAHKWEFALGLLVAQGKTRISE